MAVLQFHTVGLLGPSCRGKKPYLFVSLSLCLTAQTTRTIAGIINQAINLIKTEGPDEVSRTSITREAQAMGRLGSHPHIVTVFDLGEHEGQPYMTVFDLGEHEGQPYMVTELMGGGDVEGVIEDATDHRLPLEQVINIAKETCRLF